MADTAERKVEQMDAGPPLAERSADSFGLAGEFASTSLYDLALDDLALDDSAAVLRYGFRIGQLNLLVPADVETEVLDGAVIYPLPRGPRWLAGMINQRGNVIPLFDLFELSGSAAKPQQLRRVLLMGQSVHTVAIYIDELPQQLTENDQAAVAPALSGILRPFVEAAFCAQDVHWCEFDYVGFLHYLSSELEDEADAYE